MGSSGVSLSYVEEDLCSLNSFYIPTTFHSTASWTQQLSPLVRASLVAQWLRIACQCRRYGFDPWSGKIPHAQSNEAWAPQLLSLSSRAQELRLLRPHAVTIEALTPQ